jgi:hypothetical protein
MTAGIHKFLEIGEAAAFAAVAAVVVVVAVAFVEPSHQA